jgi:hypothetical protein
MPKDRELTLQERHDHHLRSMFWLCYIFDKEVTLRSGQPPIVGDEYCDLTLPEGYREHVYRTRQSTYEPDELPMPWLISDLRLIQIKSRAAKELFSVAASKKSDAELLLTIRELDEELERWRVSIPTEYAPSLAIRKSAKLSEYMAQSENMLQIELHLAYHHLLSIIHRASGRCAGDQSNEASETNFGLQSSLDLSVEASRSTLIFLSLAAHRLDGEAFWSVQTPTIAQHLTYRSSTGYLTFTPFPLLCVCSSTYCVGRTTSTQSWIWSSSEQRRISSGRCPGARLRRKSSTTWVGSIDLAPRSHA